MRETILLNDGWKYYDGDPAVRAPNDKGTVYMQAKTECRLWQIVLARLLIIVLINICLNTVFLTMLYGPSRLATLPLRVMKNLIQLPVDCLLLGAMCRLVQRLPALGR